MTPVSSPGRSRRTWSIALGLIVSGVFLYFTLREIDGAELVRGMARVSVPILCLSLVSRLLCFTFMSLRSRLLLKSLCDMSGYRILKSVLVAFAGNNVLPMRAGEVMRIAYLAKYGGLPASSCIAVVAVERLLDLLCVLLLFAVVWPLCMAGLAMSTSIYLVGAAVVVGLLLCLGASRYPDRFVAVCSAILRVTGPRISGVLLKQVERFAEGLSGLCSLGSVLGVFFLSVAYWATMAVSVRILLWAFGIAAPWYAPLVVLVSAAFGAALPSSPAFIGTYHYFVASALAMVGVEDTLAVSVAITGHAMAIVPYTIVSIILLFPDLTQAGAGRIHEAAETSGKP